MGPKMSRFFFDGAVEHSKSYANRFLTLASFSDSYLEFSKRVQSQADDVRNLDKCLTRLLEQRTSSHKGQPVQLSVGAGGTSLRFLLARLSREKSGVFEISASQRLLERPHHELLKILTELGSEIQIGDSQVILKSQGWNGQKSIGVDCTQSTQFISALLLNCWGLPELIEFNLMNFEYSKQYLEMTVLMCLRAGMDIVWDGQGYLAVRPQTSGAQLDLIAASSCLEPDYSSISFLAVLGFLLKPVRIQGVSQTTQQPDFKIFEILKSIGAGIHFEEEFVVIEPPEASNRAKGIHVSLKSCPDLLPILGGLSVFLEGESYLEHVDYASTKESNRVQKTAELIALFGSKVRRSGDTLIVGGRGSGQNGKIYPSLKETVFDPDHDHRMAMTAGVLNKVSGAELKILNRDVVTKSFPNFWDLLGENI